MFNKEDILARLLAGESADAIAKEMTDALNAAQTAAKLHAQEAEKLQYGKAILQSVLDYMTKFHPTTAITKELIEEGITDEAAREAFTMLDEAVDMSEKLGKLMPNIEAIFAPTPAPAQLKRDGVSVIKGDDAIATFLSKHNL